MEIFMTLEEAEHLQIAAWLQELQIYRKKEKGEKNG